MKCVIAGSRRFPSLGLNEPDDWWISELRKVIYAILEEEIVKSGFQIDAVVSGRCWGMDVLGESWAKKNNKKLLYFPAQWKTYGKPAGHIRNKEMAVVGDCLICIHTEGSRGAGNMIGNIKKLQKPYHEKVIS